MKKIYKLSFLLLVLFFVARVEAQTITPVPYYSMVNWDTSPYKSLRYTRPNASWDWINFRMLFPNGYDSTAMDGKQYPLIIMLHGAGESARMDWSTKTNYPAGDPRIDNNDHQLLFGGKEHMNAVNNGRFPGFVVFPQNFYGTWINSKGEASSSIYKDLQKALELADLLVKKLKIDPSRIYIHGLSNGGAGTWYAAYTRPDLFAAALPMSAPGDPAMAQKLATVPLWVFQGALDTNPRPAATQLTIEAVRNAGGEVRYTEYANAGHNTWNRAYAEKDFFEWMLAHSKKSSTQPNQTPTVNAGADKNTTLPANTSSFTATASDPDGSIASYLWEKVSGPSITMAGTTSATLSLSNLVAGTYTFKVTVKDDKGAVAFDEVGLVVNPAPNQAPTVNAGNDKSITLPTNTSSFTATASDPDGTIASYLWEKVSGPAATFSGANTATLSLSNLVAGNYVFKVTVADDKGATAFDEVNLLVQEAPPVNSAPVADAGADQSITLPTNSVTLRGSGTDTDGTISGYSWSQQSGPAKAIFSSTSVAVPTVSDLVAGTYVFNLTVMDDKGALSSPDQVSVVVNEAVITLAAPSKLSAEAVSGTQTNLYWQDNNTSPNEDGFVLERATKSDFKGKVEYFSIPANTTTYRDQIQNNKKGGGTFFYRIQAVKGNLSSDYSNVASAVPAAASTKTMLSAYPNTFNNYVDLKFKEAEPQEYSVKVFDLQGKILHKSTFMPESADEVMHRIELSDPAIRGGMYLIRVENKEKDFSEVIRVVKTK